MEHLSDSFSFQPHFFTLLFCLMRWKWDHCGNKDWRGIKLDSKKHFEPEYVAWPGPTSRQLKKQYSWRQNHTQVQFFAACLFVVICTAYPEFRSLNVVMWTVTVKLNGLCAILTLFIIHENKIWHHSSNGALYDVVYSHYHDVLYLQNVIPFHGTNIMKFYFGPYGRLVIPGADFRVIRNALKRCLQIS